MLYSLFLGVVSGLAAGAVALFALHWGRGSGSLRGAALRGIGAGLLLAALIMGTLMQATSQNEAIEIRTSGQASPGNGLAFGVPVNAERDAWRRRWSDFGRNATVFTMLVLFGFGMAKDRPDGVAGPSAAGGV
ncbi:MAG TPA: hypothetical protein VHC70_13655 [Phycisphaerales bacterium]|nr:hypothetical protein [Phycisphaerales bacterium]